MPEAFLYTLRCNPLRIYPPILSYVCAPNISGLATITLSVPYFDPRNCFWGLFGFVCVLCCLLWEGV